MRLVGYRTRATDMSPYIVMGHPTKRRIEMGLSDNCRQAKDIRGVEEVSDLRIKTSVQYGRGQQCASRFVRKSRIQER